MRKWFVKELWIPVLLFLSCFVFAFFTALLIPDIVLASAVTDLLLLLFAGICYIKFVRNRKLAAFSPKSSYVWLGVLLFIVLWVVTQCSAVCISNHLSDPNFGLYREVQESELLGYVILSVCIAPIAEECVFRGVIYGMLSKCFPVYAAGLISAVLFAFLHGTWTHFPVAILVGLTACFLYQVTGRLWVCMLMHFCYNVGSLAFVIPVPAFFVSVPFVVVCWIGLFAALSAGLIRWQFVQNTVMKQSETGSDFIS